MKFAKKVLLALVLIASCTTALRSQTIQIKLIDGKTGRNVKGGCMNVDTHGHWPDIWIPIDNDGVASLRLTHEVIRVHISYNVALYCGGSGAIDPVMEYGDALTTYSSLDHPSCAFPENMLHARNHSLTFSTDEVIQRGVASVNTCGTVTVSPKPGEIILFVRPRNHKEKVEDCRAAEFCLWAGF